MDVIAAACRIALSSLCYEVESKEESFESNSSSEAACRGSP